MPKENAGKGDEANSVEQRKQLIAVAEQVFTAISEAGKQRGFFKHDDYTSFEIAAIQKKIFFIVNCTPALQDLIEKQIQAQYPSAQDRTDQAI